MFIINKKICIKENLKAEWGKRKEKERGERVEGEIREAEWKGEDNDETWDEVGWGGRRERREE